LFASAFLWAISCRNSRTRFAVLFSTLLAIAGLSFVALAPSSGVGATAPRFTLPIAWAEYAMIAWGVIASAGLLRIVMGLAQVQRIRRNCQPAPHSLFNPELRRILDEFHSVRRVSLYISETLRVPAAMGFFRPAVVLPRWVIDELSPA
jgi:beta-lactamase regulating signal transducer with metallopeptidase domain